jgi:flagellar motor component MotA
MPTNQEQERLRRLRERQLTDRDPLVKQRKHQQTSAVRTRKAIKSFSFKESLSAIPRIWYGAFFGLIAGLAVILILPALWDSPFALLVGIAAAMILTIFGIITGNALDARENIKKDL